MSFPIIIEIAIGLAVVYYIVGLIVSFFVAQTKTALEMKGKDLYKVLKDSLGTQLGAVLDEDIIKGLAPYRYSLLTNWVRQGRNETIKYVEDMPTPTLASQILNKYRELSGDKVTEKDAKTVTIGTLIEPAFNQLDEIAKEGDEQLRYWEEAAQKKLENWLDGVMNKASDLYSKNVRRVVIFWAFVVIMVLNLDTIAIGRYFYNEPAAREEAVRIMDKIYEETTVDATTGEIKVPDSYQTQIDDLTALKIPIFWWGASTPNGNFWSRLFGLLISWVAISQGSSFWYDTLKKLKVVHAKVNTEDQK